MFYLIHQHHNHKKTQMKGLGLTRYVLHGIYVRKLHNILDSQQGYK